MTATRTGIRKFQNWMRFVQDIGWPKHTWPALADLWWKHHDEDGNLT